jgi:hypothetical protein
MPFNNNRILWASMFVQAAAVLRPGKAVFIKPLLPQAKSGFLPIVDFQFLPGFPAEKVTDSVEGALGPQFPHHRGKSVDLLLHIRESGPHEYPRFFSQYYNVLCGLLWRIGIPRRLPIWCKSLQYKESNTPGKAGGLPILISYKKAAENSKNPGRKKAKPPLKTRLGGDF